MDNIITSEEVLVKNGVFNKPEISNFNLIIHRDSYILAQKNIKKAMIEFAKYHVEAALKESCNNVKHVHKEYDKTFIIDKESIIECYPLTNIK